MFASRGFLLLSCVCLASVVSSTRADSDEDICTEPPDPVNGYKSLNEGNRFGDAVEFRCFENATMVGVRRRFRTVPGTVIAICMSNGRWTHEVPRCVLKVCPPLVAPRNGFIRGLDGASGFVYGMKYAIGCIRGYRLKDAEPGDEIMTGCLDNVTWSGQPAECEVLKTCPPLVAPRYGFIRGLDGASGSEYGMKYAIGCNRGYRLKDAESGDEIMTECLDNVTWSGQPAECEVVKCPKLEAPANGYIKGSGDGTGYVYGSAYAIGCNHPGYKLQGKEPGEEIYRVCQHDGQWSGQQGVCQDRKIFFSRQEWSDFFTDNRYTCCAPWREHGYQWKPSCSGLSEGTKEECIHTGWTPWGTFKDDNCYYDELDEYGTWRSDERKQVWYALLGVKVEKFGNQCCWTKNGQDYPCYESYTGDR